MHQSVVAACEEREVAVLRGHESKSEPGLLRAEAHGGAMPISSERRERNATLLAKSARVLEHDFIGHRRIGSLNRHPRAEESELVVEDDGAVDRCQVSDEVQRFVVRALDICSTAKYFIGASPKNSRGEASRRVLQIDGERLVAVMDESLDDELSMLFPDTKLRATGLNRRRKLRENGRRERHR